MRLPIKATRHRCGAEVLTGWDGDRAALFVVLDAGLLNVIGEVAALASGRRTYRLWRSGLDRRDRWNIPGHPPSLDLPVHAEHRCGEVIHRDHLLPPPATPAPSILTCEEIPF